MDSSASDSGKEIACTCNFSKLGKKNPEENGSSSTFLVNGDAYILSYRLHTYFGLNINGSPY